MKPEIKAIWVARLTDGSHKQGRGTLRQIRDGEYEWCCLGVLCDIYAEQNPNKAQWIKRDHLGGTFTVLTSGLDNASASYLPLPVMHWAGLTDQDPQITIDGTRTDLSTHNDGMSFVRPKTFEEIAPAIMEQF